MSKNRFKFALSLSTVTCAVITVALAQGTAFDPNKATELLELTGPTYAIRDMAFSQDGKRLAVGSEEILGRIWDVEQGRVAVQLTGHSNGGISGVGYTSDGKSVLTLGSDGFLKVWDASSGKAGSSFNLKCNGSNGDVLGLKNNRAIVGCGGLKIVNLQNGQFLGSFKNAASAYRIALSADQRSLIGSTGNSGFQVWDTQSLESFRSLKGHASTGFAVAYSNDGKLLATGASDSTARIWNANNGKELRLLKGHDAGVNDVAFSPDGKFLATASSDDTIKLWDLATGTVIKSLEGHKDDVLQLAWSRDGKLLASGDADGVIKLWGNE
jgi:WD40 repeat protein